MPTLPTNPDIVIIGAGAAGVGAGLALTRLGVPFLVIEAKNRVGGRAYAEDRSVGTLWDHGCHWLHSADINPLRALADKLGHGYRARTSVWSSRYYKDGRRLDDREVVELRAQNEAYFDRSARPTASDGDRPASSLVDPSSPHAAYLRFVISALSSAPPDELSLIDSGRYAGTDLDYPVTGGYGRLIERLAAPLPVRLATPALGIEATRAGVRVSTSAGTIEARAAILTVSVNVLRSGSIRLAPALDATLAQALEHVRCGQCEKIALEIEGDPFDGFADEAIQLEHQGRALSLQIRPYGRPIVSAYLADGLAQELAALGDREAGVYVTDRLADIFGSKVRKAAGRAKATGWGRDPHMLGAYSYVRVGHASAREALIAADLAPLHLAGEAMLLDHYSTAHGAYLSGLRSAHKAAERLGARRLDPDPEWLPDA